MTHIILVLKTRPHAQLSFDDPRTSRELVKAINTGRFVVGQKELKLSSLRQWATSQARLDTVYVTQEPPVVLLTPRHYDLLYGLADGKTTRQIAHELGISVRSVYYYTAEIKERFGARSTAQVLAQAIEHGLVSLSEQLGETDGVI